MSQDPGEAIFREYVHADKSGGSDRTASDRARHRKLLEEKIKEKIPDIIANEDIITSSSDKPIKVTIQGLKEWRFIFDPNQQGSENGGVGTGEGAESEGNPKPVEKGDVVGKTPTKGDPEGENKSAGGEGGEGGAGYDIEVPLSEILDMWFDKLKLPEDKKRFLKKSDVEIRRKKIGTVKKGNHAHWNKRKTAIQRIKRKVAMSKISAFTGEEPERFRFSKDDMRYNRIKVEVKPRSAAVVICVMDTTGSMDKAKKYLARSVFFLLKRFIDKKYSTVEVVFIIHPGQKEEAEIVNEYDFFHRAPNGGTFISHGLKKARELIIDKYDPSLWNSYVIYSGDGENFDSDDKDALKECDELDKICTLLGYIELKPSPSSGGYFGGYYSAASFAMKYLKAKEKDMKNTVVQTIKDESGIFPAVEAVINKDKE